MHDMVTIREAVSRTKADGIPISEYTLRQWVRTGTIPSRKAGTKPSKKLQMKLKLRRRKLTLQRRLSRTLRK